MCVGGGGGGGGGIVATSATDKLAYHNGGLSILISCILYSSEASNECGSLWCNDFE